MSDLKVTTTTTQTATEQETQLTSVDDVTADQFTNQLGGVDQSTENLQDYYEGMDAAKAQLKTLNSEIDNLQTQLDDPDLPQLMKSQLKTMLNVLTQQRDAIYDQYPQLDVIDKIRQN